MRHLAVTDVLSVQPHVETGIHAFKFQKGPGQILLFFKQKPMYIGTARVFLRNIRRVRRKGVADICVLVPAVSIILPDAGNRYLLKTGYVKIRPVKFFFQIINTVKKPEFPGTVQHMYTVRGLSVFHQTFHSSARRYIVGTIRHSSLMKDRQIFVMLRYDQSISSQMRRWIYTKKVFSSGCPSPTHR